MNRVVFAALAILLALTSWGSKVIAQEVSTPVPPYELVFEYQPGPDVSPLQELSFGAANDAEILERVVAYFEENHERLALLWREDHPTRLAGIFSMYITHISLPYGETPFPETISDFVQQERAHCGTYLVPQTQIALALGLTIRTIEFIGEHAWMEVYIDDHWELFDATTNNWINPEARLHLQEGYNMQLLRQRMPLMGISYFPPGERIVSPTRTTPEPLIFSGRA
jgi:hypothetical protein